GYAADKYYLDESSLRKDILNGYEYKIRPSKTVIVKAKLSLLNINVLDVPSQRLSVSGWLTFTWYDSRLSWDKDKYNNITDIFDTELVFWRPEIIETMTWEPPGDFQPTFTWISRFLTPFDTQECIVAFSIKLQRKPMYYVTTILIPVIVTSILCIVVFLLPAESGEKVGYSLTILLTYTVMLTLVASYMPPTSKHTSVLGVYLTIILFIGVVTTLVTVVVLHLHHHPNNKDVPDWLQFLARNIMVPISSWQPLKASSTSDFCDNYNYATQPMHNLLK
ncbi:unnamed protein product, partial [Candidula unifasciata]